MQIEEQFESAYTGAQRRGCCLRDARFGAQFITSGPANV